MFLFRVKSFGAYRQLRDSSGFFLIVIVQALHVTFSPVGLVESSSTSAVCFRRKPHSRIAIRGPNRDLRLEKQSALSVTGGYARVCRTYSCGEAAAAKTSSSASEPDCAAEIHELSVTCARARGRVGQPSSYLRPKRRIVLRSRASGRRDPKAHIV